MSRLHGGVVTVEGVDDGDVAVEIGEEPEVPPVRPQPSLSGVGEPSAAHDQAVASVGALGTWATPSQV